MSGNEPAQVGEKRGRDEKEEDKPVERDSKRFDDNGTPAPAPPSTIAPPPPPIVAAAGAGAGAGAGPSGSHKLGMTATKDADKFYPENYDSFDPDCVVADGDPQTSRVGMGKMLYIKYMNRERGVAVPLCVQAPKLFLPAGIKEYMGDGNKVNTNALCSLGREWESNPSMVAFRRICDKIQAACVRLVVNKQLHVPYCQKEEDVSAAFMPIISSSEKESADDPTKLIVYPPSFKLIINTAANNKTLLVTRAINSEGQTTFGEITHHSVVKGAAMIPMIHFNWIYRRKRSNPNGWSFSVHAAAYQAVVEPPNSAMPAGANATKLAVVC